MESSDLGRIRSFTEGGNYPYVVIRKMTEVSVLPPRYVCSHCQDQISGKNFEGIAFRLGKLKFC